MQRHCVRWVVVPLLLLMPTPVSGQTIQEIEDLFWRSVECDSKRQVELYLETYPNGAYVTEARACLEEQRLREEREIEDVFWRSVECESRRQVHVYLEEFPAGRYVAEAWACLEGQLGLDRAARVLIQQGLTAVGYDPGPADGLFGAGPRTHTRQAIRAWQAAKGLVETGYLTQAQVDTLMAVAGEAQEARRVAEAERAVREEAAQQARAADDAAYAKTQRADTATAYGEYLQAYPQGQHVQEARARQVAAETRADEAAYAEAERVDTAEAYGAYLSAYPQGRHVAEARWRQQQRQWRAGQTFRDELRSGGQGPEMVVVPAGSFQMGCVSGRDCYFDEHPVHEVKIARPFAVGKYEVTFAEWDACVAGGGCNGYRPDDLGRGRGRLPVFEVSWDDAQAYVRWLSGETGQEYRLLSEAEWEYAARAGTTTLYWWGDAIGRNRANCDGCGSQWEAGLFALARDAPVGSFAANGWGLHDVHGNVSEWVQDCWNNSYEGAPSDGRAWEQGDCSERVLRGGSVTHEPWLLRSANRNGYTAGKRYSPNGFRIARNLE